MTHSMRPAVLTLGATQVIGYGSLYYAYPILVPGIAADLGVDPPALYAILSVGLILGGFAAPWAGRMMDAFHPARVMTVGSAACAVLLFAVALSPNAAVFAATLILLEIAAVTVLYEAAFATLASVGGASARRSITHLTLIAGFASTLFWPLTGWLLGQMDWRAVYMLYAALHVVLAMPLHAWLARWARARRPQGQPASAPAGGEAAPAPRPTALPAADLKLAFWLVAISFALTNMVITALGVHLVPILQAMGLGASAYLVSMLMGPAQVAIRLTDALFWKGVHPVDVALISAAAVPVAALVILASGSALVGAAVFAVTFGIGQGLSSIVRGTVPLVLFGTSGFGHRLGQLAAVRTVLSAFAPFAFALVQAAAGIDVALVASIAIGVAGILPLVLLRRRLGPAPVAGT